MFGATDAKPSAKFAHAEVQMIFICDGSGDQIFFLYCNVDLSETDYRKEKKNVERGLGSIH